MRATDPAMVDAAAAPESIEDLRCSCVSETHGQCVHYLHDPAVVPHRFLPEGRDPRALVARLFLGGPLHGETVKVERRQHTVQAEDSKAPGAGISGRPTPVCVYTLRRIAAPHNRVWRALMVHEVMTDKTAREALANLLIVRWVNEDASTGEDGV